MAIRFLSSAAKHGVSERDALYAVTHHVGRAPIQARPPAHESFMMVGKPHPQSRHYIEVGIAITDNGDFYIFHAMEVTDLYRHLIP